MFLGRIKGLFKFLTLAGRDSSLRVPLPALRTHASSLDCTAPKGQEPCGAPCRGCGERAAEPGRRQPVPWSQGGLGVRSSRPLILILVLALRGQLAQEVLGNCTEDTSTARATKLNAVLDILDRVSLPTARAKERGHLPPRPLVRGDSKVQKWISPRKWLHHLPGDSVWDGPSH
jgi:hypothetical protein